MDRSCVDWLGITRCVVLRSKRPNVANGGVGEDLVIDGRWKESASKAKSHS